jgi:DNA mismatch repair protein MutS
VALLFPEIFQTLQHYVETHAQEVDEGIVRFDREIQFYLAWFAHMQDCRRRGLQFCYPQVSSTDKAVEGHDVFDLALATRMLSERSRLVCNDFHFSGAERIVVVSGPNNGGKTIFARTLGQMHWLPSLGMPVPGTQARLFLCDQIFTHFKREEDKTMTSGKLDEELARISTIADAITPNALLLLNESFASTNELEGAEIARQIVSALRKRDIRICFVTHLYAFAHDLHTEGRVDSLFLRAERREDGTRTLRLVVGEPLETSYGADLYQEVFGDDAAAMDSAATENVVF